MPPGARDKCAKSQALHRRNAFSAGRYLGAWRRSRHPCCAPNGPILSPHTMAIATALGTSREATGAE
eukprot:7379306-Prymnesium_polylepis.2